MLVVGDGSAVQPLPVCLSGACRRAFDLDSYRQNKSQARTSLPVPGLQAAVPDPGPLHCTEHTQARAAVLEAATQVDHGLCTPAKVATTAACSVVWRAFRLERSKPLETKRRGENNRKGEFWYKKASLIETMQIVLGNAARRR